MFFLMNSLMHCDIGGITMSYRYGFNMFQMQEGEFTEFLVQECGSQLLQAIDELMDIIKNW